MKYSQNDIKVAKLEDLTDVIGGLPKGGRQSFGLLRVVEEKKIMKPMEGFQIHYGRRGPMTPHIQRHFFIQHKYFEN